MTPEELYLSFPIQKESAKHGYFLSRKYHSNDPKCKNWHFTSKLIQLPSESTPTQHFVRCDCGKRRKK